MIAEALLALAFGVKFGGGGAPLYDPGGTPPPTDYDPGDGNGGGGGGGKYYIT